MFGKRFAKNRVVVGVLMIGVVILAGLLAGRQRTVDPAGIARLLTVDPWYCEVHDPTGPGVVASSVETFHAGGTLEGLTRLEDRQAGRLLLEFSYNGVWQFDDPWLTAAISDYEYLHVDGAAFSAADLAAIESEFAEPEVSRVYALTRAQLVYGAERSLYQCHRRGGSV